VVKVLTIRDPRTGTLIAEEPIRPKEDKDSALARIYRKTLGPDAPEFVVRNGSIWLDDQGSTPDLPRDWGSFGLAVVGPKDDPKLQESKLVLASVSESQPVARMEFPMYKEDLDAVRSGRRREAIVLVEKSESLHVGDTVAFYRVWTDPFGEAIRVRNSDTISVVIKEIRIRDEGTAHGYYDVAWDPAQVTVLPKKAAASTRR
jgi:hypothetical protein